FVAEMEYFYSVETIVRLQIIVGCYYKFWIILVPFNFSLFFLCMNIHIIHKYVLKSSIVLLLLMQ
ncbi:hypothetical protein BKA69DRAFT_1098349, partial [Paraphysoderma sedebokerense]